jgi:hypothetical protein
MIKPAFGRAFAALQPLVAMHHLVCLLVAFSLLCAVPALAGEAPVVALAAAPPVPPAAPPAAPPVPPAAPPAASQAASQDPGVAFAPDAAYLKDRKALDALQRDTFRYMWEDANPVSGMPYEANFNWDVRPVAIGGTGFGIAAVVAAVDRGWISRDQAVERLLRITRFLRDKTPRKELHGAFPHWINGGTGQAINFSQTDVGADTVETSFLLQGLLIARAYFNGPGVEETLRRIITEIWEDVDWNWFTNGGGPGLYWQWTAQGGFPEALKILGYNECMVTYVLAISSPTHPISRHSYDYWTSGDGYTPRMSYGYTVAVSLKNPGPLFLTQYSFIGLDPRRIADRFVPTGYFARNVNHVLSNRAYCLQEAPEKNRYGEDCWGLTASQIKDGYAANEPANDTGTIAPTAALASMPYTPHYSFQVLDNLLGPLKDRVWGKNGPYDAFSLRDDWVSDRYLAIDQFPIVCMVENYRSGLLWRLFMSDPDVRRGLKAAGLREPECATGFPELVVTLDKTGKKSYAPDACDLRRHPDTGLFTIPYWMGAAGNAAFTLADAEGNVLQSLERRAFQGRNTLTFPQFMVPDGRVLTLTLRAGEQEAKLPVRLH